MKKYIAIIGAILLIAAVSIAYAGSDTLKVTGGGSIDVPGGYATFGMVSQEGIIKGEYGVKGSIEYQDHVTGLNLHIDSITGLECTRPTSPYGEWLPCTAAKITGTAIVNGETGHSFEVGVSDNGEPGSSQATLDPDTFEIWIDGSKQAGGPLTGGNIQVFGQVIITD